MSRDMREVVLAEGDEGAPTTSPPRGPRRPLPSWRWQVAGALCVVAALVMVQSAVDARRQLADDHAPRAVLPVPAPSRTLAALWQAGDTALGAARVGPWLVGARVDDGGVVVVGIDPATGTDGWSVPAPAVPGAAGAACAALPADRAVCVTGRQDPTAPGPAQVVVVDTTTRTLVATWTSELQAWREVGDLVVTAAPTDDGSTFGWTLTAHGTTGATAWTTTTTRVPLDGTTGAIGSPGGPAPDDPVFGRLTGADGWLSIADRGHVWVVRADGSVQEDRAIERGVVAATRSGEAVLADTPLEASPQSTVLLDGHEVSVPGDPLAPAVDDGSAPDVDLWTGRTGGGLVARDAVTAAERWRVEDVFVDRGSTALLDGVLYVTARDEVRAYDVAGGTRRWSVRLPGVTGLTVDDGVVLATAATNLTVLAIDPTTGRARWKADVRDVVPGDDPFLGTWQQLLYVAVGEDAWVIG